MPASCFSCSPHLGEHALADVVGGLAPQLDDLVVALAGGEDAVLVAAVDVLQQLLGAGDDLRLLRRYQQVGDADGEAGAGGVLEARRLQPVQGAHGGAEAVVEVDVIDQVLDALLLHQAVDEGDALGQQLVEDHAAGGGGQQVVVLALDLADRAVDDVLRVEHVGILVLDRAQVADADHGVQVDLALLVGLQHVLEGGEDAVLALEVALAEGQVVEAEDHVLGRDGERLAVGRRQDVVGGEHQDLGLGLRLQRERDVHGHLVAVEVGVEGRADQRVQGDGVAFHQVRAEGLDAQAVQRGGAVEHDRVVLDHLVQGVPDLVAVLLHPGAGHLEGGDHALLLQLVVDEGLEQLQGHLLGDAALVQLQVRVDDDHRAAGVVDALAQQVLAEAPLLALQRVGQRLQRPLLRAHVAAAALLVVEQGVGRLLQHALLVLDDQLGRLQVQQALEAVVAVDDAAVEVVEVGGGEAAAVQAHQRPQVGRHHRQHAQHHPLRAVARLEEVLHQLQAPRHVLLALERLLHADARLERRHLLVQVQGRQQLVQRLGAHAGAEGVLAVLLAQLQVFLLGQHLLVLQRRHVLGVEDDVALEVDDVLQVLGADLQQHADARGDAAEEPDVRHLGVQLDVAHALAAHGRERDLDAALLADDALVLQPLVLAAQAAEILRGPEDLGAEQAVALGLEGAVVDGLRLGDLAVGPAADRLRRGDADLDPAVVHDLGVLAVFL